MLFCKHKKTNFTFAILFLILIPIFVSNLFNDIKVAEAASLTLLSNTLSRSSVSAASDNDVRFRVVTAINTTAQTITVDYNTGSFGNTGVDFSDIDLLYGSDSAQVYGGCASNCTNVALAATAAASTWGATYSSNNLLLTYPTSLGTVVNASDYVRILIGKNATGGAANAQMTNPVGAGTKIITVTTSVGDSGKIATLIVASNTDQIGVSATVDPTIAFTITDTTLLFGSLTTLNIRYANDTAGATSIPAQANTPLLTASTNGVSGVLISIYDASTPSGLYSATVSDTIPAAAVNGLVAGNKKFGVTGLSGSTGTNTTMTLTPGFSGTSTNGTGTISNVAQSFASSAGPVASGNAAMIMVASIDALTHAGAYSDTITVVCTGRF